MRTSELHLSNLEAGDYKFRLTVTDNSDQEDSATVTVNVQPVSSPLLEIVLLTKNLRRIIDLSCL